MLSRRAFVGRIAAGAAVACTITTGRAGATPRRDEASPAGGPDADPRVAGTRATALAEAPVAARPSAPPPWELVRPLTLGAAVAHGWRVAGLSDVTDGSCVLTLANERGRTQRIHLCRNDGRPQGLVYTRQVDLVVMNGGQGELPTDEGVAQAVAAVAHVLAANETDPRQAPVLSALLPHAQRLERFASAAQLR